MEKNEKIAILEEIMELDEGTLKEEDSLDEYDEWDSVTILALIALLVERFGKTYTGKEIRDKKTVGDILELMA